VDILSAIPDWDELASGSRCPFDIPRVEPNAYWDSVVQLKVSTLCLLTNQTYRGHCILIYDPKHVVRPDELTAEEWAAFARDLHEAARSLVKVCRPDHLNVECLGNVMPHLHWQVIPRYRDDPRWGAPIYTTTLEEFHQKRLPDDERQRLILEIRDAFT
jgi:diadenosine tetraphosphate (Ap4A) HIT family hydrolase